MALISCPECNREISDKASYCPQCGFPMKKKAKRDFVNKSNKSLKGFCSKIRQSIEKKKKKFDSLLRKKKTRRKVIFSYTGTYIGLLILVIAIIFVDIFCVTTSNAGGVDGIMGLLVIPLMLYIGNYILFKVANYIVFEKDENASWKTTKICIPFIVNVFLSLAIGENTSMTAKEHNTCTLICNILCTDLSLILMYMEIMKTYFWYNLRAMDEYDIYHDKCEAYRQVLIKKVQSENLSDEEKRECMNQIHQIIVIKARLDDRDIDTLNMVKEKEKSYTNNYSMKKETGNLVSKNIEISKEDREVIEYFLPYYEISVREQEKLINKLPGVPSVIDNLNEARRNLERLLIGDEQLLLELRPEFNKYRNREFETWIDNCKRNIRLCEEEIAERERENNNPETSEHDVEINKSVIERCQLSLKCSKEELARLENGDYELCKELRRSYESRDA